MEHTEKQERDQAAERRKLAAEEKRSTNPPANPETGLVQR